MLLLALSHDDIWTIYLGLLVAGAVLTVLMQISFGVSFLALLVSLARYGWRHLRSTERYQRLGARLALGLVAGSVAYGASGLVQARRAEQQQREQEQAEFTRTTRESAAAQRGEQARHARQEARYFQQLAAGKLDSATARQIAHAEKQWAAQLAAQDSLARTPKPSASW